MAVITLGSGCAPVCGTREFDPIPCGPGTTGITFAPGTDADDYVITSTGTGNEVQGEQFLQFDGNALNLEGDLYIIGGQMYAADLNAGVTTSVLNFNTSSGAVTYNESGGGTANFLRADGAWAVPTLEDAVSAEPTPANDQVAVWVTPLSIEGTVNFTYDGNLNLFNAGGLDQYGEYILVGSDTLDATARTTSTNKQGGLAVPHYDNTEEPFAVIYGATGTSSNSVYIGAGTANTNQATSIVFYAAGNSITPGIGGDVGSFTSTGLNVDNITEYTSDSGVTVEDILFEDGTILMDTTASPSSEPEGLLWWNSDELALNISTGSGPVLQVGQEVYILIYNDGVSTITNGQVLRPVGATVVSGQIIPTVELAQADIYSSAEGTLMMATMNIAPSTTGLATRFGRVRGFDTSHLTPGATAYLSPTTPGELTNTFPEFPNYDISVGAALSSDPTTGEFIVSVTKDITDTFQNFFNGTFRESFAFTVTSAGGVITGTLTPTNGNVDMTMQFSDGFSLLDTSPAATITLTAGTDAIPQMNYVYVLESTKVLTVSTSDWPITEHIKVATVLCRSAATTATEGALRNQNWNDHLQSSSDDMGHLAHISHKLRKFESQWDSGCELSAVHRSAPAPDELYVTVTGGKVFQLHSQTFSSFDTETGDDIHVVNNPTNAYTTINDLATQTVDSTGTTLGNRHYSVVVWGAINSGSEPDHIFMNLPSGSYTSSSSATADALNYTDYSIPTDFAGVGFLIARLTLQFGGGTNTMTVTEVEDLRGKIPNVTAGGGGGGGTGATTFLTLTDVPSAYATFGEDLVRVNAAETALEFYTIDPTDFLPGQGGQAGEFLYTNGTIASWEPVGFDVTVNGAAALPRTIYAGGAFDFLGDTTYIQIQWNQTNQQLEFSYVGPTDFYAGWDPDADSYVAGSATRVGSAHTVNFNGGTYIDTTYLFTAGAPPTHDVNFDVNLTALYTPLDARYALLADNATQTWVNSNFDNYANWVVEAGGVPVQTVSSTNAVNFAAGANMTVTWGGPDTLTFAMTTAFGTMSSWNWEIDGTPHAINNTGTAELIAGTGINISYTLGGAGEHQATITNPSPGYWTQSGSDIYYNTGSVGIGTASPDYELHVADTAANATINIEGAITGWSNVYFSDTTNGVGRIAYDHTNNSMDFYTNSGERMVLTSIGRLGIGTTSPDRNVHIASSATTYLRLESTDTSLVDNQVIAAIEFETRDSSNPGVAAAILARANGVVGWADLVFQAGYGGVYSDKLTIYGGGDIRFQTGAEAADEGFYIEHDYSAGNTSTRLLFNEGITKDEYGMSLVYAASANPVFDGNTLTLSANHGYLMMHDLGSDYIAISIDRATASPILHYAGSARVTPTSAGVTITGAMTATGSVVGDTYFSSSDNIAIFSTNSAGTVYLRPTSSGVSTGEFNVNNTRAYSSTQIQSVGEVTSYSSDERLKTNIRPIDNPLEIIKRTDGVVFDWRDGVEELGFTPTRKTETGYVAQVLQRAMEEAVSYAPFDRDVENNSVSGENYLTTKPEKLIPVITEAIKILDERLKKLEQV